MVKDKMAVEVIFDTKQERILDYVELDPTTLSKKWCNAHKKFVWFQYENDESNCRILYDTQILTNF